MLPNEQDLLPFDVKWKTTNLLESDTDTFTNIFSQTEHILLWPVNDEEKGAWSRHGRPPTAYLGTDVKLTFPLLSIVSSLMSK